MALVHLGSAVSDFGRSRPRYHPNHHAAFVIDPDGHNVEAVCHVPGEASDQ